MCRKCFAVACQQLVFVISKLPENERGLAVVFTVDSLEALVERDFDFDKLTLDISEGQESTKQ